MNDIQTTFDDLGLSDTVARAVKDTGYTTPTEIQAKAIPLILRHSDVIGIAQTGTGKTASFTLPMICRLEKGRARARMPRSLILEPTRELAAQVAESFTKYGKNSKLEVALLIGGASISEQEQLLMRGVDVLIATPGRLIDHFEQGRLLLNQTEILVIDEADRMLDMGFIPDIEKICSWLPFTRQNLLFSATMPSEIRKLVNTISPLASEVSVSPPSTTSSNIEQIFVGAPSDARSKRERLREVLAQEDNIQNAILFCNRKRDVAILARSMQKHGFNAECLHGDMAQSDRLDVLNKFKNNEIQFLTASDVAARGLDIPSVSHVINFDIPTHAEDYVHRIGRTGRAGRSGKAFTFVSQHDQKYLDSIVSNSSLDVVWHNEFGENSKEVSNSRRPRRSKYGNRNIRNSKSFDQEAPSSPSGSKSENRAQQNRKNDTSQRYNSQKDIGEMNLQKGSILGFGEHTPAFFEIGR